MRIAREKGALKRSSALQAVVPRRRRPSSRSRGSSIRGSGPQKACCGLLNRHQRSRSSAMLSTPLTAGAGLPSSRQAIRSARDVVVCCEMVFDEVTGDSMR
jgi:hypothetical protein